LGTTSEVEDDSVGSTDLAFDLAPAVDFLHDRIPSRSAILPFYEFAG